MGSLVFYLLFFAFSTLCFYRSSKANKSVIANGYAVIGLSIPVIIAAFRYKVGVDYTSYVLSAINLSNTPIADFLRGEVSYFEPTMYIISKMTFAWQNQASLFFGIYAAVTVIFFYFASKKYNKNNWWIIMALFLLVVFSPSLNAVRQFASVAITFYASTFIIYYSKHRWKKFFTFMVLAYLFHSSAVFAAVLIPIIFFLTKNDRSKTRLRVTLKSIAIATSIYLIMYNLYYLIPEISIFEKYSTFIYDANVLANNTPNHIVKIAPILISFLFYKKLNESDLNFTYYYTILFVALAVSLFGNFIPQGYRLADYFTPYYFVIFALLLETTKRYKFLIIIAILSYAVLYFTVSTFINNSYMTFPYRSILEVQQ